MLPGKNHFRSLWAPLISIFFITGCQSTGKPVTQDEASEFAKKVEISIGSQDASFLDDAVDSKILLKRTKLMKGADARSFEKGFSKSMRMGTAIVRAIPKDGEYVFIKQYEDKKDKSRHVLFRLYFDGKLNYHDMELVNVNGKCKVADIYMYVTGEKLSETLRNLYIQAYGEPGKSNLEDADDSWMNKLTEIRSLVQSNKHQEALNLYNEIPASARKSKLMQVVHVSICSGLDEKDYSDALEEYRKSFPNEPNLALLMIDGYVLRKEYSKALDAVNQLDRQIDKDPFLDYYRYFCYNLLQDKDKSRESIERLVKNNPDFSKGVLELIATYLEEGEYDKARPYIDDYRSRARFDQLTLTLLLYKYPGFTEKKSGSN